MDVRSLMRGSLMMTAFALCTAGSARAQSLEAAVLEAVSMDTIALEKPVPSPLPAPAQPLRLALTTSFVALQALDTYTTLNGVHRGSAVEANPLMGGLAQHPAAFVAVKSALTAATVVSLNSVSKKHPKAAMLAMIALNAGSAFIVRSNFQLTMSR